MADLHTPTHPIRLVTASALFDGHDASINIMRRIFQSQGAEVVHLGHNRSVQEVVDAALEEDVQGVALSSYQGGHVEYFSYLVERLAESGRAAPYGARGDLRPPPTPQPVGQPAADYVRATCAGQPPSAAYDGDS